MLRNILYMLLTLAIALTVGFGTSLFMLENGRQLTAKRYGPWYGWPDAGIADIDPAVPDEDHEAEALREYIQTA